SMQQQSRRGFLGSAAFAAAAAMGAGSRSLNALAADAPAGAPAPGAAPDAKPAFRTTPHKAMIVDKLDDATLKPYKDASFQGVEVRGLRSDADAAKGRETIEKLGMRVHSVMRGWAEFNSADANKVNASWEETAAYIKMAGILGADTVLTVPCRIGGQTWSQSK